MVVKRSRCDSYGQTEDVKQAGVKSKRVTGTREMKLASEKEEWEARKNLLSLTASSVTTVIPQVLPLISVLTISTSLA